MATTDTRTVRLISRFVNDRLDRDLPTGMVRRAGTRTVCEVTYDLAADMLDDIEYLVEFVDGWDARTGGRVHDALVAAFPELDHRPPPVDGDPMRKAPRGSSVVATDWRLPEGFRFGGRCTVRLHDGTEIIGAVWPVDGRPGVVEVERGTTSRVVGLGDVDVVIVERGRPADRGPVRPERVTR